MLTVSLDRFGCESCRGVPPPFWLPMAQHQQNKKRERVSHHHSQQEHRQRVEEQARDVSLVFRLLSRQTNKQTTKHININQNIIPSTIKRQSTISARCWGTKGNNTLLYLQFCFGEFKKCNFCSSVQLNHQHTRARVF